MADFFDSYKEIGGGKYIGKDEKAALIESGVPLTIEAVVYQEESKFGARYVTQVLVPNFDDEDGEPETRLLSFGVGTVDSRDRMLAALAAYLDTEGATPPQVKLERVGQAVLIVKAQ